MHKPTICLVTPAFASANNGNWQTASRWARMLSTDYRVRLSGQWPGDGPAADPADLADPANAAPAGRDDVLIALHARRSAASVARWAADRPGRPLVLVLTGTDLYRDIHTDAAAQEALARADRLVVLHELAPLDLAERYRSKCVVCFQSTTPRRPLLKTSQHLRVVMVGHLRSEKAPETYFSAARLLADRSDIRLDHVGDALDATLGAQAEQLQRDDPYYRWLGGLPHAAARQRIQRAHLLVHPSRMEGGAHVVMEAVCSGTPVLASRIPGNVGMLGRDYAGYFDLDDSAGLAALLRQCRDDAVMLPRLAAQCAQRAPLFEAANERHTLRRLVADLLVASPAAMPPEHQALIQADRG